MILQGKIDRAFKWLKDKNKARGNKKDKDLIHKEGEEALNIEKKDYLAIFISSSLVLAPIFLVLLAIAVWAFL